MPENKPLTIDDLGMTAHNAYARAQEAAGPSKDFSPFSRSPEVLVTTPIPPAYEGIFGIRPTTIWAALPSPPPPSLHLFTFQLAPSLGPLDQLQELLDRLIAMKSELLSHLREAYQKILSFS